MVKIIIDSASDYTKQEAEAQGFVFMAMPITFGDKEYNDGEDLLAEQFYDLLEKEKALPKTSQIVEYRYYEKIKQLTDNGDEVVVITISSNLSSTYENAKRVCAKFKDKAFAVDSFNASLGEKILGQYAMQLSKENFTAKEIYEQLEKVKNRIKVVAVIDTLEYLKKGGRLSGASAIVGALLNVKPIISIENGLVKNTAKAMGQKKAFKQLIDLVKGFGGIDFTMPYGFISSGKDQTNIHKFLETCKELLQENCTDVQINSLGSTIGTHIGPGAVGVAFFTKE